MLNISDIVIGGVYPYINEKGLRRSWLCTYKGINPETNKITALGITSESNEDYPEDINHIPVLGADPVQYYFSKQGFIEPDSLLLGNLTHIVDKSVVFNIHNMEKMCNYWELKNSTIDRVIELVGDNVDITTFGNVFELRDSFSHLPTGVYWIPICKTYSNSLDYGITFKERDVNEAEIHFQSIHKKPPTDNIMNKPLPYSVDGMFKYIGHLTPKFFVYLENFIYTIDKFNNGNQLIHRIWDNIKIVKHP